jgi:peptidyl-tRNA hydrolase, PTH1 family
MIKLLVGLGNPGPEYEDTRHNAGFWWLESVARELGVALQPDRHFFGRSARATPHGQPLWLLAPTTYMNRSGQSVAALARFFKIAPHEVLVAHDELDLPAGEIKLKQGGGHAGHNGLRDIHAQLGSPDYWRLRIGIGHPGERSEVVHWVLKKPAPDQREAIAEGLARSLQALPDVLADRMAQATARLHTRKPPRPKPPRPAQAEGMAPSGGREAL